MVYVYIYIAQVAERIVSVNHNQIIYVFALEFLRQLLWTKSQMALMSSVNFVERRRQHNLRDTPPRRQMRPTNPGMDMDTLAKHTHLLQTNIR